MITFSEGTPDMPLYKDAEDFAEVYPFIPYQFKLLGNVLTSVRQYSSSGKHLADGERSMLALFKEAAEKYENEREGILVPFNAFTVHWMILLIILIGLLFHRHPEIVV